MNPLNIDMLKEIFHEKASCYGQLNETSKTADSIEALYTVIKNVGKCGEDFTGRVDVLAVEPTIAVFRIVEDNWDDINSLIILLVGNAMGYGKLFANLSILYQIKNKNYY